MFLSSSSHLIGKRWKKWILSLLFIQILFGQIAFGGKKVMDHDVYDVWNIIKGEAISPDGRWVLWSAGPDELDDQLVVAHVDKKKRAYSVPFGVGGKFSPDSRFVVSMVMPPKKELKKYRLKKENDEKAEEPKKSAVVLNLADGEIRRFERVKSFVLPEDEGSFVAILHEPEEENGKGRKSKKSRLKKGDEDDPKEGCRMSFMDMKSGDVSTYDRVMDYKFSRDGKWLVFVVIYFNGGDVAKNGVYGLETASGKIYSLMKGEGDYSKIGISRQSDRVAFISNRDDLQVDESLYSLYQWKVGTRSTRLLAKKKIKGLPKDWGISRHGEVSFSWSGRRVLFGTGPKVEIRKDDEKNEDEEGKATLDIWHWKDPHLQSQQLVDLKKERKRSYQAIVDIETRNAVQLARLDMPEVKVGSRGDSDVAVGNSNYFYRKETSWKYPPLQDVYLVSVETGERTLVLSRSETGGSLSPESNYLSWWSREEGAWYVMPAVEGGQAVNVSSMIPHSMVKDQHDWPYLPGPFGGVRWTKGDEALLVNDRHDIWLIDPVGTNAPKCVTEGFGRENDLRLQYVKLDPDEVAIDPNDRILLSAMNLKTKASGYYRDKIEGDKPPKKLKMMNRYFGPPKKAKKSDRILYKRESFKEFPNLWVSDLNIKRTTRVSDVNPQQKDYLWGSVELVSWSSLDGGMLDGLLYKPEDFDPEKKYPMLVYFYEKNSDYIHRHMPPAANRSIINRPFYTSRGYLIFVPDIPYKIGYPGESAVNAIMSGVTHLISEGFVDEENIGVQGHSWGGYQTAYLVTQTNLFKAAEAGAVVSNMTSAYGGIRTKDGTSRMNLYESWQSRIGGTLWEYPFRFIENSPLFAADKIETPLLILHNDGDDVVPWSQGVELFVALRRLGKPVWMLNYNGEPHWPTKIANRKDFNIRMQQFFDHYLKGAPAPVWMVDGIPAIEKGEYFGLEPAISK
jgi:dipeptidyl aminopeptidase/acylaminoacyl peptidase